MNRTITSLVGVTLIAGMLYRPVGPTTMQPGNSGGESRPASRAVNSRGTPRGSASVPAQRATTGRDSADPCADPLEGPQAAAKDSLPKSGTSADSNHASLQSSQNFFSEIGKDPAYKDNDRLRGFIATVPDPARTRLALWFDRDVDSIVAAAQKGGYNLDHFWLPWTDKPPEPEPDCYWQLQAMSEIRRREQEPGLITFRKTPTDDSPSFLLVFLVGESPIWGIDKLQFRNAVKHLKDAGAYSSCLANGCQIDVVGPSFSGSASSLASEVKSNPPGIKFSIISPTITGRNAIKQLEQLCNSANPHCLQFTHGLKEDSETWHEFWKYLTYQGLETGYPDWGGSQPSVGFISESETSYGGNFVHESEKPGLLYFSPFRFPRNISWLREAYGQNSQMSPSNSASNNPLPRQLLPLILNVPQPEEDSPPDFAKQQTPLSQEMEMAALSERLRQDQIRLAVIAATDPLDTIFVMQFLHRRDPELQFAVFDSDLLFLRADDEVPPEGLLSVSPYPLLASREILSEQGSSTYPSNYARVEYEACLQALPPDRTGDSGPKDSKFSSSLWLTVVGRTGYWPVSLLGPEMAKPPFHLLDWMLMPRVWLVVWETVNFLCGLYVLFFWAAQYLNRRTLENFRLFDRREDPFWKVLFRIRQGSSEDDRAHRPYVMMRSFYLLISMVALWLIRELLLFPATRAYGWAAKLSFLVFVPLVLTTLFLLLVVIVLAVVQRTRAGAYYAVMALVAAGAASWLGLWWFAMTNPTNSYALFLCYRSVSLTSGVSPVVPLALLLLAGGIWAWRQLDSMAVGIRRPYLPAAGVNSHFRLLDERIQTTLHQAVFNWPAQALALGSVILVWWITHVVQSRLMSVERSSFTLCFQLLLFIVLWLVFDQWLRFCVVWIDLRGVLERLEQLRFREAFTRLPKQFSGAAIWQQGAPRRSYKLLTRSIDSLTALDAELRLGETGLTARLPGLRAEFKAISKSEARGTCPSHPGLRELQKSLRSTAEKIASSLRGQWDKGLPDSLENLKKTSLTDQERQADLERRKVVILKEEFLALRYTAYIRNTCIQMRNLLFFPSAGFILALLAVESYPFAQHRTLGSLMVGVFVVLSMGIIGVFVGMERNSILSRLAKTEKEGISWDLFFRLATFGALPLFTVIASQYPSVARALFSWVGPVFQAVKP